MNFEQWSAAARLLIREGFRDIVIHSGGENQNQEIADISALAICDMLIGKLYRDCSSKLDSDITFDMFKKGVMYGFQG